MPHLRIEYSENMAGRFDGAALTRAACDALLSSGVFNPPDSIKVRLIPVQHFRVGSGADHGFVHAELAMLSGRDKPTKQRLTEALVLAMSSRIGPGAQMVQITADARDMDRDVYAKRLLPAT